IVFVFSSRRRHTRFSRDWSSDVCSSDLWRSAPWSRRRKRQTSHLHGSPCPVWALASPYPGCREVKRARRRGQSGPETIGRTDARSEERRVGQEGRAGRRRERGEQDRKGR